MPYRYRRAHMLFVALGAVPIVIWRFRSHTLWPDVTIAAYLLTAGLVLTLMIGYPGPGCRWYWKPVALMMVLHTVILSALTIGAFAIVETGIKPPVAMFFSLILAFLALESWVALRFIGVFLSRAERPIDPGLGKRGS